MLLQHQNSYHVKELIKSLGGKWQPLEKGWLMPNEKNYLKALQACQEYQKNRESADDVEDIIGFTKYNPYKPVSSLNVPLKDNRDKPVISGLIFSGYGNDPTRRKEKWIVTCKNIDNPIFDKNDFLCINETGNRFFNASENEIRTYVWIRNDLELAKNLYKKWQEKVI